MVSRAEGKTLHCLAEGCPGGEQGLAPYFVCGAAFVWPWLAVVWILIPLSSDSCVLC